MTYDKKVQKIEQQSEKAFYVKATKRLIKGIENLLQRVDKFVEKPHVTVDNFPTYPEKISVDNLPEPVTEVDVKNFPKPVKEVSIKNFPEPVEEVSIKNFPEPVDEVTIKNPVDEVTVKNMPEPETGVVDAVTKTQGAIFRLPTEIQKVLKQTTQGVVVENDRLDVVLIDPETKKPYKAGGGGVAVGGGSSWARSDNADTSKITVGSSSTSVVSGNRARIRVVLVNDSNETIYLGYGEDAVLNEGIRLNANGGSMVEDRFTGAINAICSSGSKNLTVVDIVL